MVTPAVKTRGIGVLGGTFDPIHQGHITAAKRAAAIADLAKVLVLPLGVAVHRPQPLATPSQRLAMCALAIENQPLFAVDDREIRRGGGSYTIITARELRREYGKSLPIFWLLGADAARDFTNWHDWEEILSLCNLLVMARGGYALKAELPPKLQQICCRQLDKPHPPSGAVLLADVDAIHISSSQIRRGFANADERHYLQALAQNVREYALLQQIY